MADTSIIPADSSNDPRETSKEARGGFGIYKPSRGYWVRMLTAVAAGVLFLAAAGWAFDRFSAFNPPVKGWDVTLTPSQGTASVGQKVELFKNVENKLVRIGDAVVEEYSTAGTSEANVRLGSVNLLSKEDSLADTARVTIPGAEGASDVFAAGVRGSPRGVSKFERIYVQAGAAAAMLALGVFCIYRFVGNKPSSVDFLIATDEEMRKVNWSTRKVIVDSTYVVIGATLLIALFIFVVDFIFKFSILDRFVVRSAA